MKKYCIIFFILVVSIEIVPAAIKNGYENQVVSYRLSLKGLNHILSAENDLTPREKRRIKEYIKSLIQFISYYEITEKLLNQFRTIAPALYNEIDTIKNRQGRITDVYVKFIPKDQGRAAAAGTTSVPQIHGNDDTYSSSYGNASVSVEIWLVSKALLVLAHELGHVKYQVPNLNDYTKFYKQNYIMKNNSHDMGHDHNDPSGRLALASENNFKRDFAVYLRTDNKKFQSPVRIGLVIRKQN